MVRLLRESGCNPRFLEAAGGAEDDGVIGEGGIAMLVIGQISDTGAAVSLDGPWGIQGEHIPTPLVLQAGIDGDDISGPPEAVALAESVTHGDAFHATSEGGGQAAEVGDMAGESAPE